MHQGNSYLLSRIYSRISDNTWLRWTVWIVLFMLVLVSNTLAGIGILHADNRSYALFYQWFAVHSLMLFPVLFSSFLTLPVRNYSVTRMRQIIGWISVFQMFTYSICVILITVFNGSFLPFTWYYVTTLIVLWVGSSLIYLKMASHRKNVVSFVLVLLYIFFLNFISLFFSRLVSFVFE